MKHLWIPALVVALLVGFAVGQAVEKLKFPYVSKELNAPCGKTEFEWRCATKNLRPGEPPAQLTAEFDMTALVAEPGPDGLTIKVNAKMKPGIALTPKQSEWLPRVEYATRNAVWQAQERFGDGKGKSKAFADTKNLTVEFYIDGKLAATRTLNGVMFPGRKEPYGSGGA